MEVGSPVVCGLLAMDYASLVEEIVVGKEVENKVRKIAQI